MNEQNPLARFLDLVKLGVKNIRRRPVLSALTTLGIATGMTAIVGLWMLTSSIEQALAAQFERFGHNTLLILPSAPGGTASTQTISIDPDFLTSLEEVESTGFVLRKSLPFTAGAQQGFALIIGLSDGTYTEGARFFEGFELESGRLARSLSEITISNGLARQLQVETGALITISEESFTIAGILTPSADADQNSAIFMDINVLWALNQSMNEVSFAWVKATDEADLALLEQQLIQDLSTTGQQFSVQSAQNLRLAVQSILKILSVTFTGVAAIALFVGALGLMNTMYMAVIERTREIGIYLSLGARKGQILLLFVIEAGTLGLIGGMIGVLLGTGLASSLGIIFSQWVDASALQLRLDAMIALQVIALSILLGIIAGTIPAYRAALIRPADALRYE